MTAKKMKTNGISTSVVMEAEAIKSRTDSNARKLAAKDPADAGRSAMRSPSTRPMMLADKVTSMRLPAVSNI